MGYGRPFWTKSVSLSWRASRGVLPDVLRHLVAAGADVYQFTPHRMSLEELFLSVMGEDRGL